ncbi:lytic transglycosylase [Thalassotalea profundi]|uniref:Lytic transglycosylase n=1 Tax=Thalassotalea profundi TaxID=2036687 RepID=A0ABQ3IZ21_9GAMM|nr:lytic transglycosylase [Thalassotalea profundi]
MLFFITIFYTLSGVASADSSILRDKFAQADKLVWDENSEEYRALYNELHFYPLQPYLDQKRLMYRIKLSDHNEISKFLTKYRNTPLDWPLRKKWLNYLKERDNKLLFVEYFKPTSDVELTCQYYRYKLALGTKKEEILSKITPLWVVGKSQPKVCDPLFSLWQKAGYRTKDIVWERLGKAADGGKHTLIPYLTSLLPTSEQYLGKLWHKVRKDPSVITKLSRFPQKSDKEAEIFVYGIKRFIWRDPNRALHAYQEANQVFQLNHNQQQQIALKFALALASKKHEKAQYWLQKVDDDNLTSRLIQWRIADVLRQQDWPQIKAELISLPLSQQKSSQWKYWYARSLVESNDDKEKGLALLQELAETRHYYGFLAASIVDTPINFQNKPILVSEEERREVFKHLAGKRAFELFHLKRYYHARMEWNYWMTELNDREKLVAAKLANEIGWYDRAIFALSKVGYLDDVDLRFPLAFNDEITLNASKYAISPAWAFAITRRESSFMSDANSPVGAKGLMQVMPATAKQLTKRKRISKNYLFDSEKNINLGTKYLKKLLDKHQGNWVLATAAYNAGPYRVKSWLKSVDSLPADIWIETIPFYETREYVKSVMAYEQIYQAKVGQPAQLFDKLTNMSITQL